MSVKEMGHIRNLEKGLGKAYKDTRKGVRKVDKTAKKVLKKKRR
jgi:hypothetical protein